MRKAKAVTRTRSAFVAALTTACVFGAASYAQSDMDQVKAAVDAYHATLSALDAAKMESLWAHDDSVMDIEPSAKAITLGWDAVKKNFEAEFNALSELKVTQADGPEGRCGLVDRRRERRRQAEVGSRGDLSYFRDGRFREARRRLAAGFPYSLRGSEINVA